MLLDSASLCVVDATGRIVPEVKVASEPEVYRNQRRLPARDPIYLAQTPISSIAAPAPGTAKGGSSEFRCFFTAPRRKVGSPLRPTAEAAQRWHKARRFDRQTHTPPTLAVDD